MSSDGTLGQGEFAVYGSNVYSSNYVWKAFDKVKGTWWTPVYAKPITNCSLTVYTRLPLVVRQVWVRNRNIANTCITNWSIYGSINNVAYTVIASGVNEVKTSYGEWYMNVNSTKAFKYHKIIFDMLGSGNGSPGIDDMEFFGKLREGIESFPHCVSTQHLIKY